MDDVSARVDEAHRKGGSLNDALLLFGGLALAFFAAGALFGFMLSRL